MKFAIQVNEGPYQHQAADSAFQFAKAAIDSGHEVIRVFFYHDGVNNASRFTVPPQDDRNVVNNWASLNIKNDKDESELVVCIAAALRRGLLDASEAEKNSVDGNNIHPEFRISGLGQLIEAGIQADRLVVFGD